MLINTSVPSNPYTPFAATSNGWKRLRWFRNTTTARPLSNAATPDQDAYGTRRGTQPTFLSLEGPIIRLSTIAEREVPVSSRTETKRIETPVNAAATGVS